MSRMMDKRRVHGCAKSDLVMPSISGASILEHPFVSPGHHVRNVPTIPSLHLTTQQPSFLLLSFLLPSPLSIFFLLFSFLVHSGKKGNQWKERPEDVAKKCWSRRSFQREEEPKEF